MFLVNIFSGTFAVVCLMTGKTVLEHSDPSYFEETELQVNATDEVTTVVNDAKSYTPTEVATAVTFCVAVYQVKTLKIKTLIA